jgi:hypothetical protein
MSCAMGIQLSQGVSVDAGGSPKWGGARKRKGNLEITEKGRWNSAASGRPSSGLVPNCED